MNAFLPNQSGGTQEEGSGYAVTPNSIYCHQRVWRVP